MSHSIHQGPEGAVWYDDCRECAQRARDLPDSLGMLDSGSLLDAWRLMRAVKFAHDVAGIDRDTVLVTTPDWQLISTLYAIAVMLERIGLPPDTIEHLIAQKADHQ